MDTSVAEEEAPPATLYPKRCMPNELKVGDRIVTSISKDGSVAKSTKIEHLKRGRCCRNYHINRGSCYHRHVAVLIAVPEEEQG
jgi:hypothetical protein